MENKKEIWEHYKLSRDLPDMEMITAVKENLEEFAIEGLSCDLKEVVRAVFPLSAVIAYRRMKSQDTYKFESEEQGWAGFVSVSKDSAFLNWYKSVRLFENEEDPRWRFKSYAFSTDSDVIEVISYGPPKIYYGEGLVVAEEDVKE